MAIFHKLGTFTFRPCGLKCKPVLDFRPCGLKYILVLEMNGKMAEEYCHFNEISVKKSHVRSMS